MLFLNFFNKDPARLGSVQMQGRQMVPALKSWTLRPCISHGDFLCFLHLDLDISTSRPEDLLAPPSPNFFHMYATCRTDLDFGCFFLFFHNPVLLYKLFQSLNGAELMQSFLVIASPKSSINLVIVWCITPHLQANWPSGWRQKHPIHNPLWKITLWYQGNAASQ